MNTKSTFLAAAAAASMLALPIAASAAVPGQHQIHGTVTEFNGKYDLHVERKNGTVDDVRLHQGTIINPTGLTLRPGMRVTILGTNDNGVFAANEIDTPYHVSYVEPIAPYYGYGFGFGGPFWGPGFGFWY